MKLFLRILAVALLVVLAAVTALYFYLSDERLKELILPRVNESLGTEVSVERIGFSLVRTFPDIGLVLEQFTLDTPGGDPFLRFDELMVSANLVQLLSGEVQVNRLEIAGAQVDFEIQPDGSTTIDFLTAATDTTTAAPADTTAPMQLNIDEILVSGAHIRYTDRQTRTRAELRDLNLTMAVQLAARIETELDATLGGLSLQLDGVRYLDDLALSLQQTSSLDLEGETLQISRGVFSIRGLGLNVEGELAGWSQEVMQLDLAFTSGSDDFGALLDLVPEAFAQYTDGIESRGALTLNATVQGGLGGEVIPDFNVDLQVEDGFLKHPDAAEPVEEVFINLLANNERVDVSDLRLQVAGNTLNMQGWINAPLSANPRYNFDADARFDLATIREFYPIDEDTLMIRGMFTFDGSASGNLERPEDARISGALNLTDGFIRHRDIARPIENIRIRSTLTASEIRFADLGLTSGDNTFEGSGTVTNYMRGTPQLNMRFRAGVNLDEIDDYYSLEAFMMELGGRAEADLALRGPVDNFDAVRFQGGVRLTDTHVRADSLLPEPIRAMNGNLTFSDQDVRLQGFRMMMGASNFSLDGSLNRWRNLMEEPGTVEPAFLTATYRSRNLNMDELIDWEEETESEPLIIELPNLETRLTASVDTLTMMGIEITQIRGRAESDTRSIRMPEASAQVYDGSVSGNLRWDVTRPDYFDIQFIGDVDNLRAEAFFNDFQMTGTGKLHEYLSGGFSASTDYKAGMNAMMEQDTPTILAGGSFGVSRGRLRNHPIQNAAADLLGNNELRDLSLDTFDAQYAIEDGIMTLTDLNITSRDIGMVMNGTQNLLEDRLDYALRLRLPERYDAQLGRLLTPQVVEALKAEEGIVVLPLALVGSSENPRLTIDRDEVQRIAAEYLRQQGVDSVEDAARRLIRGFQRN
ncbi:MAG: AsmA protein [Bacteroidetes bacterium HLUCCA01]|nr:MAG: AsmA protein [Bacteroidetes bacterium HLUCCA01]